MGYYSELAIEDTYCEDYSYPSPEMQLRWRIEDLKSRLEDIAGGNYGVTAHYYMGRRFSKGDLAHAPPEYFSRVSDIMTAISIAEEKLTVTEVEESNIHTIFQLKQLIIQERPAICRMVSAVRSQIVSQRRRTTFSSVAKTSLRKPILRSSFHICSIGFISGVYGGIEISSILWGTFKDFDLCQAAPSQQSRIISSGNCFESSPKYTFMQSVLH